MLESLSEHFALLYYLLLSLISLVGLVLVTIGIPGQFFPGILALICWFFGICPDQEIQNSLGFEALFLLGLAFCAEFIEFVSGYFGGKSVGSSRRGAFGAILGGFVGGIVGNLLLPLLGGILGILLGTAIGAYVGEKSAISKLEEEGNFTGDQDEQALKVSFASMIGRLIGLIAKLTISMGCLLYSLFQLVRELW